jgi:hypothetical protein
MKYIIDTGKKFDGTCQNVYYEEKDLVPYSNGMNLKQYLAEKENANLQVISQNEFNKLYDAYMESRVTEAKEITREEYEYGLNVLPPCRFSHTGDVEYFHISERIQGNLVAWYAKFDGKFYQFNDFSTISSEYIFRKIIEQNLLDNLKATEKRTQTKTGEVK